MPETSPERAFAQAAAASSRVVWLDGGGTGAVGGVLGVLAEDDVSLTFDATTREVRRHRAGGSEVVGDDVFAVLAEEVARDAGGAVGGPVSWVGYLGYACRTDLPGRPAAPGSGVPDAVWLRVPAARTRRLPPSTPATSYESAAGATSSHDVTGEGGVPGWYAEAFTRVQDELAAGNSYEVNLTYREVVESTVDPVTAYLRLRRANPAPYSGYLQHDGVHLLSSSPERYATVDRRRWVEARPIKGTTPRGATPAEDAALAAHLAQDPKLRAENLMITDLLRNDLAMVCEPGTVTVPSLMAVESYAAVHQLVTTVRGRLRDEVGTVEALRALFPAGSMTGAPKRRTMAIVDEVEATPRGVYAGAFGWLSDDGRADLSVVIRSLVGVTGPGGTVRYELGTGGGITVRSDPAEEWAETRWKAERVLACLR